MTQTPRTRVLHVVSTLGEDSGGPARYITELCAELAARGHDVTLLTAAAANERTLAVDDGVRLRVLRELDATKGFSAPVHQWASEGPGGLIHLHGIWLRATHDTVVASRRLGRPLLLAPMGMLEPWALGFRAWKKRLAWWLYQRRDLASPAAFHATSDQEAQSIRRLGLKQPVAVIPLGVRWPAMARILAPAAGPRVALFLSRVHPKKGLLLLIEAWAAERPPGWRLMIAGRDEGHHEAEVRAAVRRANLDDEVELIGPVHGEAKEALFRRAELLVLPSYSENFALVVPEALARGVPVITTTGTPWEGLVANACGWWVAPAVEPLRGALHAALTMPRDQLAEMGRAGARWARARFGWESITNQVEALYARLLTNPDQRGPFPPFATADEGGAAPNRS